jgi:hypothetical protein
LSVDNRLADPASPLDFKTEYIVGLPHTLAQQRISADHLSQLVERVPSIKHTLLDIVSNVVALSTDQAKEILNQHFKEMKELSEENTDRQRLNPHNDVMAGLINTTDEINRLLDLLEVLSMKGTKMINKFLDLLKIVFAEQEFSIEKLKILFERAKRACLRL